MISVKYQVLFFDPAQNREQQLSAIQPVFHSPSAIKVLLKTVKYENKKAFIYSGIEDDIEQFLKIVARKDTTDWLSFDAEKLEEALDSEADDLGLNRFDYEDRDEEQVLGDPPLFGEERMAIEAGRKSKIDSYPTDVPAKNHWLWDEMSFYKKAMNKRCGKDLDKRAAAHRILYQAASQKLGFIPFSHTTVREQHDVRSEICKDIEGGEDKASGLIETWERHLKSDGLIKKTKPIKYLSSNFEAITSRYFIAHIVEWGLGTDWKVLSDYLTRNHAFQVMAKDHLAMTINRLTKLEIIQDAEGKASLYISHVFTPHQATTLTGKVNDEDIVKTLHKYAKEWYSKGTFPNVKLAVASTEEVEEEEAPYAEDLQTGSSHPENWQTAIQTGKSTEELRQDAIALAAILHDWQYSILQANDLFKGLTANSDKYLQMFSPIVIKGLSREKLEAIATICTKIASMAAIV